MQHHAEHDTALKNLTKEHGSKLAKKVFMRDLNIVHTAANKKAFKLYWELLEKKWVHKDAAAATAMAKDVVCSRSQTQ